jgi:hypothetical protein
MSERGWKAGKGRENWFVAGDGCLWLSTARISKRNAIKAWLDQAFDSDGPMTGTWPYWYRRGYRAVKAKIKFKVTT